MRRDGVHHARELGVRQRKWLLDEHGFAALEGRARERSVRVMAGCDEQRIDIVVVEDGLGADRCVRKPEPALRVDRSQRAAGRDVHEVDVRCGRKVRQQHRRRVVTGADEPDPQWSSGARDRATGCPCRRRLDRNRTRGDRRQRARILEQVADAAHAAGHQAGIDLGCDVDGERLRHEGLDVEEVTREQIDEAREIAPFRPADIGRRIVDALELVAVVVSPGSVGAREADVELLVVVGVPREIEAALPDVHDPGAVPSERAPRARPARSRYRRRR